MTKWSLVLKVKLSSGVCGFYCWNPSRLDIDGYVHCYYASLRKFVWTDWLSKHNRAAQLTLKFSSMIWWSSLRRWVEQLVSGHLAPLEVAYIQSGPVGDSSRCKKSHGQPLFLRRGVYIVEGSRYDFEDVLAKSGLKIEEESLLVEQLKDQPTKLLLGSAMPRRIFLLENI